MKSVPVLFIILITGLCSCNSKVSGDPMSRLIPAVAAKEDLKLFKEILVAAHPSFTLYRSRRNMDDLVDSISASLTKRVSIRELYNALCFISNKIGCSHTNVFMPDIAFDSLETRQYFFPYPVIWVENKLLVNATGQGLPEGTEIVSINGIPAEKVLEDLSFYNPVDGYRRTAQLILAARDFSYQYYLRWGAQRDFTLVTRDSVMREREITKAPVTYREWRNRFVYNLYYFDATSVDYDLWLDDTNHTAVMRIATFDFEGRPQTAFKNFFSNSFGLLASRSDISNLIIDLRENTGGKLYDAALLFSYLTPKAFTPLYAAYTKNNIITYDAYLTDDFFNDEKDFVEENLRDNFSKRENGFYYYSGSLTEEWEPEKNRFKGNVYIITNANTVSSASFFATMVKNSGVGKIIGDETSGGASSGNGFSHLEYQLPVSKITVKFPYSHLIYNLREDKTTGKGVVPHYVVPDTRKSFKNNEDNQFNYIMDSLILN